MRLCLLGAQGGVAEEEWRGGLEEQDQPEAGRSEGVQRAADSVLGHTPGWWGKGQNLTSM